MVDYFISVVCSHCGERGEVDNFNELPDGWVSVGGKAFCCEAHAVAVREELYERINGRCAATEEGLADVCRRLKGLEDVWDKESKEARAEFFRGISASVLDLQKIIMLIPGGRDAIVAFNKSKLPPRPAEWIQLGGGY